MILYKFLKEKVQNIALLVAFLVLNMMLVCSFSCLFQSMNFIKIYTGIFLNSVKHSDTLKRLAKIHLNTIVYDFRCAQNSLSNITVKILCQIHHAVIICICLVKLHQCKFWIMTGIKTLVTEYAANLIYFFKSAYDQALQIKLQRNTKLQIFVKSVEMCFKRSCRSSSCIGNQHRSFYFHKAFSRQIGTDRA